MIEAEGLSLDSPEKWVFQRATPKAAEALAAVCDIEVETFQEMLATPDWRYSELNGFEWKVPTRSGKTRFELRWTGPLRRRLMNAIEAWETLATRGVIPEHWVGDSGRRFHGAWRNAAPPDLWSAVAYACDPDALSTIETLGLEVAHRLAPWYQPHHQQVAWRILSRKELDGYPARAVIPGGEVLLRAAQSLRSARTALAITPPRPQPRGRSRARTAPVEVLPWDDTSLPPPARALRRLIAIAERWSRAGDELLDMAVSVRPSDLASPWDPLLKLWRMGYGLDSVSRRNVTLIVPGLI